MCGARNLTAIFRITVPILMPAILGATLLGFIKAMESFEVELLLGAPVGIYIFTTKVYNLINEFPAKFPPAMALSMVFLVMIFILVLFQRWVVGGREYHIVREEEPAASGVGTDGGYVVQDGVAIQLRGAARYQDSSTVPIV